MIDCNIGLYMVDPAGACYGYKAVSSGAKSQEGMSALEKMMKDLRIKQDGSGTDGGNDNNNNIKSTVSYEAASDVASRLVSVELSEVETIEFAIEALQKVLGIDFKANQVEVALVSAQRPRLDYICITFICFFVF